ncbi:unnamed protein product [Anisakis simplex]|uniref:Uncharacterized protein n=1 Tax=Anisakis simplex TaxID=6269 RepID=A0A3P6SZN4_ANISI|nr:unnamed protein product [Anisakis simplex]
MKSVKYYLHNGNQYEWFLYGNIYEQITMLVSVPTSACTVTALESNLFVIGGWNPRHTDDHEDLTDRGYVRTIYKYNLYLDLWTTHDFDRGEQGFPIETACHCTFELNNDKLLVLGGSLSPIGHNASSDRMYIYSVK